jgi:transcription elongation factor Elf1
MQFQGEMRISVFPCPRCTHKKTTVQQTDRLDDGMRVRRRKCDSCGHLWYTEQPPEQQIVDTTRLVWCGGMIVGLRPPAESTKNEKM